MFADRLRKLAFYLRNEVKDERFNLATWAGSPEMPWEGKDDLSCGTSACAMGWATTIPEFKELGLYLVKDPDSDIARLHFGEYKHFEAAAKFLDITENEAEYLFNPDKYDDEDDTPRLEVCERIEDFVVNGIPDDDYEDEDDYEDDYDDSFDDEEEEEDEDEDED